MVALSKGVIVAERFRVDEELGENKEYPAFLGTDAETGARVALIAVAAEHAPLLARVAGVEHQHLARVLAVTEVDGQPLLVAEHVPGMRLDERLATVGKKQGVDAVRTALRLADALAHIHEHGGVHGFVSPHSLIIAPDDRPGPVLGFLTGSMVPLRAPGKRAAPTTADDSWAAGGLLYWMLTGLRPPPDGFTKEPVVAAAGVVDPALRSAIYHALASDVAVRSQDMRPLRRDLARWFVEHANEESVPPGPHSGEPPPLPSVVTPSGRRYSLSQSSPELTSQPPPPLPQQRSKSLINHFAAFALTAVGLGLIAGWVFSALKPKREIEVIPLVATSTPSANAAIELTEVPVTAGSARTLGGKLASCVAGHFPPDTFGKTPDTGWLCSERDPRVGADGLRVAIVGSAPKGPSTQAQKIFARIGWYDMAAYAVVRAGCCPDAPPLHIDKLAASCPQMDEALREIGDSVVAARPPQVALKKYTDSIHCELNAGHEKLLRRSERPGGGEASAFLELVKKLEAQ